MMNLARKARLLSGVLTVGALCGALCTFGATAAAQQGTITGRVTVAGTNDPVALAHVIAVGTNSSAVTGQDGRYTLKHLAAGPADVQVLRGGFQSQKKQVTVQVPGGTAADFSLAITVVKLAEVVTTATGQQRAIELGHTTTTIGDVGARMESTPTTLTVGDLLVQKAPSVNVLGQGMIGTASSIRLRGLNSLSLSNEPIIVVDGARVASTALAPGNGVGGTQTSLLNSFAPEEIESIEILKGPAASTEFGTNAANGVILITTKKGRVGHPRWSWLTEQGRISDNNDYPASYAIWGHAPSSSASIRCLLPTMGQTTCLQDSVTSLNILKDDALSPLATGRRNLYGMQVNGGSDAVRFFISGNVENALGPVRMPGFAANRLDSLLVAIRGEWKNPEALQRENFRANMNATLTPTLELGVTGGFVKSDQRFPQSDNSPVGLFAAARESPGFNHAGLGYTNVGALGERLNGYNLWLPSEMFQDLSTQDVQRETLTGNVSWRSNAWLQHEATTGIDYATFTDFNVCRLNECPSYTTLRNGQSFSRTVGARTWSTKWSSIATWAARADLNLKTSAGVEYMYVESDASNALGIGLPPGAQNVGQAAGRTNATNITATAGKTLGFFIQEQAALRDRLFFTLGLRSDENSAFGSDYQWAHYPKASVSWLMSDEAFFPKLSWLDQFRPRMAYGVSGIQPGLVSARRTYAPITSSINGTDTQGLVGSQTGNPDLRPERTSEFETGFNARMFQSRVNLEVTYFNKKTKDVIVNAPIAASSTSSSLFSAANVGSVKNSGLEAVITTQLADRKGFAWDLTLTASHGSNQVLAVGPSGTIVTGNTWQAVGYPIDALFYRGYTYADANTDGRIQPSEVAIDTTMRFAGYQIPRDLVSVQNGFDLLSRRLRLTALIDYKGGHSVFDASSAFLCQQFLSCPDESNPGASLADQARSVANRYGNVINGTTYTTGAGYLSNGRFWRLREVAATLTLPDMMTKRLMRADRAVLNFGVRNLHVWSSYKGVDPESNFGAGDIQTDFMTAGPPTYYTLRLNLHY